MICVDLFAGAGGLSEGFSRCGFDIRAHVEMNISAAFTLKTREAVRFLQRNGQQEIYFRYLRQEIGRDEFYGHIPPEVLDSVICEGISSETIEEISNRIADRLNGERIDVLIGGPPCQAYSTAGRGRHPEKMENDPRNYLYLQYIDLLNRFQPRVFLFENVKGLFSAKQGTIFEDMQDRMKNAGYRLSVQVLNAKDFGVPQDRKRIFLVGVLEDEGLDFEGFEIPETPLFTIRELFSDLPPLAAGGGGISPINYAEPASQSHIEKSIRPPDWNLLTWHIARPHRETDLEIYANCVNAWNETGTKLKYNQLPEHLVSHQNTKTYLDRFNVVPFDDVCHTMVAHISKDGHYYIHPDIGQNRSLSVREAARVQSFPDDYFFEGSRTAAFTQIGNAVPPLLAEYLANQIWDILEE